MIVVPITKLATADVCQEIGFARSLDLLIMQLLPEQDQAGCEDV